MTLAYVGLGSNLGEAEKRIEAAMQELDRIPDTRLIRRSSLYRSAPMGYSDQAEFTNAVAQLETSLPATELLAQLHGVEARHGRERSFPNAPRVLDLDLLLYGDARISGPGLTVPHPRMHERAFVLKPLLQIDPDAQVPGRGRAKDLLQACAAQRAEPIID